MHKNRQNIAVELSVQLAKKHIPGASFKHDISTQWGNASSLNIGVNDMKNDVRSLTFLSK